MSVTQQIARLAPSELQACRESECELAKLTSFQLLSSADYLDLGWAPSALEIYFKRSKQKPCTRLALYLSLNGSCLVNSDFREGASSGSVYSDIACLDKVEVQKVRKGFDSVCWTSLEACLPKDSEEANKILGISLDGHPNEVYIPILRSLIGFCEEASIKGLCLAMWWD